MHCYLLTNVQFSISTDKLLKLKEYDEIVHVISQLGQDFTLLLNYRNIFFTCSNIFQYPPPQKKVKKKIKPKKKLLNRKVFQIYY